MENHGQSGFELLVIIGAALLASLGGVVWLGAWVAAAADGARLHASFSDAVAAAFRLPANLSNPRLAWPAELQASLPGPLLYWGATALLLVGAVAVALAVFRLFDRSNVGTLPRRPLGVDARARFATAADLKPLSVRGPHPGRFLLGRRGRVLLATELPPQGTRRGRRRHHQGDRGAVALIGPSRSGKTTAAITGILEWEGPAVLSSVKADLLATTCGWRKKRGTVLVYDPTRTTGDESAIWSPLRAAKTVLGAQRAARALCEAAPRSENLKGSLDFWLSQAEILLFGLLFVAARTGVDMARVCEWVMVQDRPREDGPGDVRTALDRLLESEDPEVQDGATRASQAVMSIWEMEEETRSSIFATAQTVVWPWADPGVAAASRGDSLSLDWLLGAQNTLYLCAPIEDQERLAPAFGGLLNDLVKQVFLRVAATGRPLDPPLLIVIDEAGNTPLRALPQYASTLAGLGVLLVTIWQSIAQIEDAYGRQADTILTNHLSKVFYTGLSDPAAFRYIGQVLGDVEVETRSRSEAGDWKRSLQLSTTREPLVPPHMARQMPPGDALLIHGTLPPAHIRTKPWWGDRRLAARGQLDPDRQPAAVPSTKEVSVP
ncbi:MAG TPA: type IV secretory system conjugative DNA transfer family protein [Acidimicrobiales bacterium]|nr:type IV secretory system conjugative DNA transfer family protein [Acidimicrobiales bacterium]